MVISERYKVGDVIDKSNNTKLVLKEYKNSLCVMVEIVSIIDDKKYSNIVCTSYGNFVRKNIKGLYERRYLNRGYVGEGDNKLYLDDGNESPALTSWYNMIRNKDNIVCKEWECFQTFATWYNKYHVLSEEKLCLYSYTGIYNEMSAMIIPINVMKILKSFHYPVKGYSKYKDKYIPITINSLAGFKRKSFLNPDDAQEYYSKYKFTLWDKLLKINKNNIHPDFYNKLRNMNLKINLI